MREIKNPKEPATGNYYDYEVQALVKDGKYVRCGHPGSMDCKCYGKEHAGEEAKQWKL